MKQLLLYFFAVALLVSSFACERHPISQTIPDFEKKQVIPSIEVDEKK
ncbi:MAG: hypothetical protein QE493_03730 [Verrucomicrobiae bacterium]|jgi:hypothetical protein|nr:hypothetical protein [Verrucomicrobiae bacterium]